MKTFNRGKLRKLVEAGKVVMVSAYHFDDMYGESRTHKELPVAMKPADWKELKQGICYLTNNDFSSESGCAYQSIDTRPDRVTLIVHSNSNYELRILP